MWMPPEGLSGPRITSCIELMQMILPAATDTSLRTPRRRNSFAAARAHSHWPVRLTPIAVFHWATVMLTSAESRCRPAFATRMSSVPKWSIVCLNMASTSASFDTSALMAIPLRPDRLGHLVGLADHLVDHHVGAGARHGDYAGFADA